MSRGVAPGVAVSRGSISWVTRQLPLYGVKSSLLHHRVSVGDPPVEPAQPLVELGWARAKRDAGAVEAEAAELRRESRGLQPRGRPQKGGTPSPGRDRAELDLVERLGAGRQGDRMRAGDGRRRIAMAVSAAPAARSAGAGSRSDPAPRSAQAATRCRRPGPGGTPSCNRTSLECGAFEAAPSRGGGVFGPKAHRRHLPATGPAGLGRAGAADGVKPGGRRHRTGFVALPLLASMEKPRDHQDDHRSAGRDQNQPQR